MSESMTFDEVELQKVAALYCEGKTRSEISDMMSKPESEVQRMIEHAEQLGYVQYRPQLTVEALFPEVNDFVYNLMLTDALRTVLADSPELSLMTTCITRSPNKMFTHYRANSEENSSEYAEYREAEYLSLQTSAMRASEYLCSRLFDGSDHTVGVNWGISVKLTIAHMRPVPSQLTEATISIISLFGDLDFHPQQLSLNRIGSEHINCNTHVAQLALRLGGRGKAVPLNVPGFIPAEFAQDLNTFNGIRRFLGSHSSYRRIFGELPGDDPTKPRAYNGIIDFVSDAKITHTDTIITGFGSADTYTDMSHFLKFWLDASEIQLLLRYCNDGKVVGDIAGHLVPSIGGEKDDELKRFLQVINRRILAAQPSDFADVASRHRKNNIGAGVVGVTVGARKAKIIARLLSLSPCPISALFIDTHCALALLAELSRSEFRRFVRGSGRRLLTDVERWSADSHSLIPVEAAGNMSANVV